MGTPSPNLYPDPSYAQFRWAWETNPGVPPLTGWHDAQFEGEKMAPNFEVLERNYITRGGERPAPLDSKITHGASEGPKVDALNPEQDWWLFAALFGHAASPVLVEAAGGGLPAAYRHRLSRSQTAINFPPTFSALVWRDDNKADRSAFGQIASLGINFAEKALVSCTPNFVFSRNDYWDDAIRTAGTGTALPVLRGSCPEQWGADDTQNWTFHASAQDANTITGKWVLGDTDVPGATPHVYNRGVWQQVLDENDFPSKLPGVPVEVYFPLTGTFSNADVFTIARKRLAWPQTLPASMAVSEALSTISIDGVDAEVKTGSITCTAPAEAFFGFGGRHARRSRTRGQRDYKGTIAREYLDTSFLARLVQAKTFTWKLVLDTGVPIGASGVLTEQIALIAKNCKLSGPGASVTDPKTLDEALVFSCHPSSDGTYPSALTAEIINSIPDLAAA